MNNQPKLECNGLTVKDLVTTGIFSAIFFIFTMFGGVFFAVNPVLTFYMPKVARFCADRFICFWSPRYINGGASPSSASLWVSCGL